MPSQDHAFDIDPQSFLAEETFEPTGNASLESLERELGDVEQALIRLDEGRYGTCVTCGADIADVALSERPAESLCTDHRADPSTG